MADERGRPGRLDEEGRLEAGWDPTPEEEARRREENADRERAAGGGDIGGRDMEHAEEAPPRGTTAFGGGPAAVS